MIIIRAAENQLAELAPLQKMYMEHHAKLDDYFTFEEYAGTRWINYMKKFLKENNNIALIALEKQTFIGYMTASIYTRRPIYKIKKVGLIGDNFVLPNYRRKNVFSKMLEKTLIMDENQRRRIRRTSNRSQKQARKNRLEKERIRKHDDHHKTKNNPKVNHLSP
jgi:hypothetical protein